MAKADRVLALLEALQDRPSATGPELARAARRRRPHRPPRRHRPARPRHPGRGRARARRLLPPQARLPRPAADVHQRRGGVRRARADGRAPARDRHRERAREGPPRPARTARGSASRRSSTRSASPASSTPPRPTPRRCWRSPRPSAASAASTPATPTPRASRPPATSAPTASSPTTAAGTSRPTTTCARTSARCAPTASARSSSPAAPSPPPKPFDAVAFVSRALARVPWTHEVEVVLHTTPAIAQRRFPPTLAELEPHPDGTLLRLRADSLDWAAGLLAAAGCDFTVHHPDALRAALRRLANRLTAT